MAERPDCARMDQFIPELAIGVAAGDERARVLGHLARCVPCRSVLESASAAADALLLVAPEREPPPGFETRVLGGMAGQSRRDADGLSPLTPPPSLPSEPEPHWSRREPHQRPRHRTSAARPRSARFLSGRPWSGRPWSGRRAEAAARPARPPSSSHGDVPPPTPLSPYAVPSSPYERPRQAAAPHRAPRSSRAGPRAARWRRRLLRLATTVTIAGLVGGALWWRTDDDRHLAAGYRATLAIAHGQYMRAASLLTQTAVPAGYIVAYEGEPSWVIVIVRTGDVSGDYAVRLTTRDGRPITLGTMNVEHGQGTWGATISTSVDQIAAITLTSPYARAITARLG